MHDSPTGLRLRAIAAAACLAWALAAQAQQPLGGGGEQSSSPGRALLQEAEKTPATGSADDHYFAICTVTKDRPEELRCGRAGCGAGGPAPGGLQAPAASLPRSVPAPNTHWTTHDHRLATTHTHTHTPPPSAMQSHTPTPPWEPTPLVKSRHPIPKLHLPRREWADYHLALGAGRLYVFDTDNPEPSRAALEDLIAGGAVEYYALPHVNPVTVPQLQVGGRPRAGGCVWAAACVSLGGGAGGGCVWWARGRFAGPRVFACRGTRGCTWLAAGGRAAVQPQPDTLV